MRVLCLYGTRKSKPRVKSELCKQQYSVTHFDCNHLAHVMVLWQMQKFLCYCTVFCFALFWIWGQFPSTSPRGTIFGGRLNERVFGLRVWVYIYLYIFGGAYTWRGLFSEFYGILNSHQDRSNELLSQARFLPCLRYLWTCVGRRGSLI